MNAVLDIGLLSGPLVVVVCAAAAVAAALLVVVRPGRRWRRRRWIVTAVIAMVVSAALGLLLTWFLSDVQGVFEARLSAASRFWIAVGFAGVGVAAASLWRCTPVRAVSSLLAAVLFVGAAAMGINIDFGQYPTIRSALGISVYSADITPYLRDADPDVSIATWTPPADMPEKGMAGSVTIAGTVSGFAARPAVVYLPPAALTATPPALPVLIVLSGQPGSPQDPLLSSKLEQTANAYAAAHQGLAPIIVSPDQLGAPMNNPMCVDSALGNSATYLTVDVTNWITTHLPVLSAPHDWGIGGLSQGGTCAIQLGAAYPQLYGSILDASGEEFPKLQNEQTTIDRGFGGDRDKYAAAHPAAIMAANAPYTDTVAVFGVGSEDSVFLPGVKRLYDAATAAGMSSTYVEAPGSGHDATTWSYVFAQGLAVLAEQWGLNR